MTKKDQIISMIKEGKTVEEIQAQGFNRKYILQVKREINNGINSSLGPNSEKDNLVILLKKIQELIKFSDKNIDSTLLNFNIKGVDKILNAIEEKSNTIKKIDISININIINDESTDKKVLEPKFNPINICRKNGQNVLLDMLNSLRIEELKELARQYTQDPRGYLNKWQDKNKIIDYIIERAVKLSEKGGVFNTEI